MPRPLSLQPREQEAKPYQIKQFVETVEEFELENGFSAMTPKYHINVFWSEADGACVADVPDLRSCSAFGDTPAEAPAEVEKAMDAWFAVAREDGSPIPEPQYNVGSRAKAS